MARCKDICTKGSDECCFECDLLSSCVNENAEVCTEVFDGKINKLNYTECPLYVPEVKDDACG